METEELEREILEAFRKYSGDDRALHTPSQFAAGYRAHVATVRALPLPANEGPGDDREDEDADWLLDLADGLHEGLPRHQTCLEATPEDVLRLRGIAARLRQPDRLREAGERLVNDVEKYFGRTTVPVWLQERIAAYRAAWQSATGGET